MITWKCPQQLDCNGWAGELLKTKLKTLCLANGLQRRQEQQRHTHKQPKWKQTKTSIKIATKIQAKRTFQCGWQAALKLPRPLAPSRVFSWRSILCALCVRSFHSLLHIFFSVFFASSSTCTHPLASWDEIPTRQPAKRIRCLRMRERAACLCCLTTAYIRRNTRWDPLSQFSMKSRCKWANACGSWMHPKEKNDELNPWHKGKQMWRKKKCFFFQIVYVKLCVWFVGQYLTRVLLVLLLQCSRRRQKRRTRRRWIMLENAWFFFLFRVWISVCKSLRWYSIRFFGFHYFWVLCSH